MLASIIAATHSLGLVYKAHAHFSAIAKLVKPRAYNDKRPWLQQASSRTFAYNTQCVTRFSHSHTHSTYTHYTTRANSVLGFEQKDFSKRGCCLPCLPHAANTRESSARSGRSLILGVSRPPLYYSVALVYTYIVRSLFALWLENEYILSGCVLQTFLARL